MYMLQLSTLLIGNVSSFLRNIWIKGFLTLMLTMLLCQWCFVLTPEYLPEQTFFVLITIDSIHRMSNSPKKRSFYLYCELFQHSQMDTSVKQVRRKHTPLLLDDS